MNKDLKREERDQLYADLGTAINQINDLEQ